MRGKVGSIYIDSLGQGHVTFNNGTKITISEVNIREGTFEIRALEHTFAVHMTGASNIMRVEMKPMGGRG